MSIQLPVFHHRTNGKIKRSRGAAGPPACGAAWGRGLVKRVVHRVLEQRLQRFG